MKYVSWFILILVVAGLLTSCSIWGDSPERGAQEWIEGVVNQDGNQTLKRTCLAQRDSVKSATIWFSAFSVLGQMLTSRSVEIKGDISDLKFETISQGDNRAEVRVYGELRSAVLGAAQAQQIDERWQMVREDDTWRWCGNMNPALAEEIAYEATATVLADQRDAVPPATAEQIAAAEIFQQYASEQPLQYRNARYETTSNDGTFADIVITFEAYDPSNQAWLEAKATITLRQIGGDWKGDKSNITGIELTNREVVINH